MENEKDTTLGDGVASEELGANGAPVQETSDATPKSTPTPAQNVGDPLAELQKRLDALEARSSYDPNEVADAIRTSKQFKQQLKALTENSVRAQIQTEVERLTKPLDELEEVTTDSDTLANIARQKKAITQQVKDEFAKRQQTEESAQAATQVPGVDWRALGMRAIQNAGLTQADIPELSTRPVDYAELTSVLIPRYARAKAQAQSSEDAKAKARSELETQSKRVKNAATNGANTPPPDGQGASADEKIIKRYRNSGRVGNAFVDLFKEDKG